MKVFGPGALFLEFSHVTSRGVILITNQRRFATVSNTTLMLRVVLCVLKARFVSCMFQNCAAFCELIQLKKKKLCNESQNFVFFLVYVLQPLFLILMATTSFLDERKKNTVKCTSLNRN